MAGIEPSVHFPAPGKKAGKQPGGREHGNRDLKNAWDTQWGDYSFFLECFPERQHLQRCLSRDNGASWEHISTPMPLSINWEATQCQHRLLNLLHQAPHPCTLVGLPFSVKLASVPGWPDPPPTRRATQTNALPMSPKQGALLNFSFGGGGVRSHFTSR